MYPSSLSACVATFALLAAMPRGKAELTTIDFNRDVRPILSENCFTCHGPDEAKRKGKLRLDLKDDAFAPAESGEIAIVPGNVRLGTFVTRAALNLYVSGAANQKRDRYQPASRQ